MKKNLTSLFYSLFLINLSFSQAPEIEWENSIGGNDLDYIYSASFTADGGYILGASSYSNISVDKSEDNIGTAGFNDYWIIKLNSAGIVEWENTIGSESPDEVFEILQTSDGGYFVAGYSSGGLPSGDKTLSSYGSADFWLLKLDASGNILFQKGYGGNSDDIPTVAQICDDGGFVIGGYSYSGDSGNKSEPSQGGFDYWVIRLSSTGKLLWQNTIGGSADDFLYDLHQTSDDGFILGGYSKSGISGDKTEASLGVGYNDYWVVKIDSSGVIEWQNTLGGNFDDILRAVRQTPDGGYILGGRSNSGISADKSESSIGSQDPWIIKLNSVGDIQWENTYSEVIGNEIWGVENTVDGGYIFNGGYPYWLLKLNTDQTIDWEQTFSSGNELRCVKQTPDQGYLLAGTSNSGISAQKSEPNFGSSDLWIVKLEPDLCLPVAEICNGMDDNCDALIDNSVVETISIIADGPTTICSGAELDLFATHSGTSIQWKKNGANITGATSSTYSATTTGTYSAQTSSDCDTEISNEIFVQVNKKPNAFIYADGPTSFCAGGSVTLIANTGGGLSYQWYKGVVPIAGATNINYVATTTGNYKCLVTKIVSGCNKQSNAIAVAVTCKEGEELFPNNDLIIYPNPSTDKITIGLSSNMLTTHLSAVALAKVEHSPLTITDLSGKTIAQYQLTSSSTEIDISNFAAGIYFVKMIIGNKQLTEKFIKQ